VFNNYVCMLLRRAGEHRPGRLTRQWTVPPRALRLSSRKAMQWRRLPRSRPAAPGEQGIAIRHERGNAKGVHLFRSVEPIGGIRSP
jgi:hypothetical protein